MTAKEAAGQAGVCGMTSAVLVLIRRGRKERRIMLGRREGKEDAEEKIRKEEK